MIKFSILLLFPLLFINCTDQSETKISIVVYETIPSDEVYDSFLLCDSMLRISNKEILLDTYNSGLIEKDERTIKDTSKKSILQLMYNIYNSDKTGEYYFVSKSIFGKADNRDTSLLNVLLSESTCKLNGGSDRYYRWVVSSSDDRSSSLLVQRSKSAVMECSNLDFDSINLTFKPGVLELLNQINRTESVPKTYSLNIVLKKQVADKLFEKMKSNMHSGYVAIVSYGGIMYLIEPNAEDLKKNTLSGITYIDESKIESLEKELNRKINVLQ